jgi:hypothetical protein
LGPLTGGVSVCRGVGCDLDGHKKEGGGGKERYTARFA